MKTTTDLQYSTSGLFAFFITLTAAGETAWRAIAKQTEGTGKVFAGHLPGTLTQLRAAGYVVRKATKPAQTLDDALLDELFN